MIISITSICEGGTIRKRYKEYSASVTIIMGTFMDFWNKFNGVNKASRKIEELQSMVSALTIGIRPFSNDRRANEQEVVPAYPWPLQTLYDLSRYSDILTIVQTKIRDEILRNGYELVEAEKTDGETVSSEVMVNVDQSEKKQILEFLERCNDNGQDLEDVLGEFEDDLNISDDAYLLFVFEYSYKGENTQKKTLKEMLTISPIYTRPVMNKQYIYGLDDEGQKLSFCVEHREELQKDRENCKTCGKKLEKACFRFINSNHSTYYSFDEVVHCSKYRPSKGLGFSPVVTLWQKTKTLLAMDSMSLDSYEGKKMPKQLLIANTANRNSFVAAWNDMKERAKDSPHMPAMLAIEQSVGGNHKEAAQLFNFMNTLEEMQYIEARQEMRTQIGAIYGVEPIFQGDLSASGGLNNEGLQITVTNRASERGQKIYNKKVLPRIIEALGVEGWVLKLKPSEEQDEMAKLERQQLSLQNGQAAISLGLEAEYNADTMEVVIKSGPLQSQMMSADAGVPGAMGMNGSPSAPASAPPMVDGAVNHTTALNQDQEPATGVNHTHSLGREEQSSEVHHTLSSSDSGRPKVKKSYLIKTVGEGEVLVDEQFISS
jgi:hypothetical protein